MYINSIFYYFFTIQPWLQKSYCWSITSSHFKRWKELRSSKASEKCLRKQSVHSKGRQPWRDYLWRQWCIFEFKKCQNSFSCSRIKWNLTSEVYKSDDGYFINKRQGEGYVSVPVGDESVYLIERYYRQNESILNLHTTG